MANERYNCPWCGDNSYKTVKKGGITRCCGEQIVRVNGAIYISYEDAPEWRIINAFVEGKRKHHNLGYYTVVYGTSAYKNAALPAAKLLLEKCDGDIDLALRIVEISFTDWDHKRRKLANMFALTSSYYFPDALAKAKRATDTDERKSDLQEEILTQWVDPAWERAYAQSRG